MSMSRRDFLKTGMAALAYAAVRGVMPESVYAGDDKLEEFYKKLTPEQRQRKNVEELRKKVEEFIEIMDSVSLKKLKGPEYNFWTDPLADYKSIFGSVDRRANAIAYGLDDKNTFTMFGVEKTPPLEYFIMPKELKGEPVEEKMATLREVAKLIFNDDIPKNKKEGDVSTRFVRTYKPRIKNIEFYQEAIVIEPLIGEKEGEYYIIYKIDGKLKVVDIDENHNVRDIHIDM